MPPPLSPHRHRPPRHAVPASSRADVDPTTLPFGIAPIAATPRLRVLTTPQRRRWLAAATATGMVLTAQAVHRSDAAVAGAVDGPVTGELLDETGGLLTLPSYLGVRDRPMAAAPRPPFAADAPATPVGPSGTGAAPATDLGALPDGLAELARYDEVRIATEGRAVELVGFHESSDAGALALEPAQDPAAVAADGAEVTTPVIALPTRGRAGAPTSAIDLAVTPGATVTAPVTGEVVEVADYALYGRTRDQLVHIRAAADPDVVVQVFHVEDTLVTVGDTVEAGVTPIAAQARQLPFDSQIDRFTTAHRGAPAPHVHIELRRA